MEGKQTRLNQQNKNNISIIKTKTIITAMMM